MSAKLFAQDAIGNVIIPTPEILYAWQTDAYPHGERRTWMEAYCVPLLVVSSILTAIRVVLRSRKRGGGFGLDDAFLIASWLLLVAFTIVVIWSSKNGTLDRHMWDVDPLDYPTVALSAWLGQIIFLSGTCLIRVSILLFYRRMVKGTFKRRWKWSVWAAIGFTVAWTLAFCIMLLATCQPVEANWKVFDPTYTKDWTCADTRASSYAAGVLAVMSDCYSLILPWAMIWPLEMPRRQKLALNLVFSVGVVVVVAAGLRTKHAVALGYDRDSTWVGFWVYFWTLLEWNLAIICNCAPSLRAFFRAYLKDSVDKALNSFSTRSRYRETQKDTTASQSNNIELKRTITVESEKPFNVRSSVRSRDCDTDSASASSQRLDTVSEDNVGESSKTHERQSSQQPKGTFLDMRGSPPKFVPTDSPWSSSGVNVVVTGPNGAKRPSQDV